MTDPKPLRIAIIGGGLAGATLINGLLKHPHLSVDIFESAPEFTERGAAVGLAKNAQIALGEIGADVVAALDNAGAVKMHSSRLVVVSCPQGGGRKSADLLTDTPVKASGDDAGATVFDISSDMNGKVVHRAAFLAELLKPVPASCMHTSKKLNKIEPMDDGTLTLSFADNTTHSADAIIGADGIHGLTRSYILGPGHPALKAAFAGFWDCRAVVLFEKARAVLGDEYLKEGEERQYGWLGDCGFMMHDVMDSGKSVQCVASVIADEGWGEERWKRGLERSDLESAFGSCRDSPIKEGMIELLLGNPDLKAFEQWHFIKETPTFAKARVCIVGDAAHAMTPWQGSGAGQAIEDAMVLSALLGEVRESVQLDAAFMAYDHIRRPRAQRIIASSHATGRVMCGRGEGIGLDVEKIRDTLASNWEFIHNHDQQKQKDDAVQIIQALLQ